MASSKFTFIAGDDDYLVDREGKAAFEKASAESDEFTKEIVDGLVNNVSDVESAVAQFRQAIQTLSLFGEKKTVWFRSINFLADSRVGQAEGTKAQVALLTESLEQVDLEAVTVILTAFPVDRRRKEYKALTKSALVQFLSSGGKGGEELVAIASKEAHEQEIDLTVGGAEMLVAKVGGNTRLVIEEVRKLAAYLGDSGEPADEALVNGLVPQFGEGDFFELAEAFYARDLGWTRRALQRHFFHHKDARGLLITLHRRNSLLIQLRALTDGGDLRGSVSKNALAAAGKSYADLFGGLEDKTGFNIFTQNPWYLGRLRESLRHFSLRQLLDCQRAFVEAFRGILDRPNDQESVLQAMAVKCLG